MLQETFLEEKLDLVAKTEGEIYLRRGYPNTSLKVRGKPRDEIEYWVGPGEMGQKRRTSWLTDFREEILEPLNFSDEENEARGLKAHN